LHEFGAVSVHGSVVGGVGEDGGGVGDEAEMGTQGAAAYPTPVEGEAAGVGAVFGLVDPWQGDAAGGEGKFGCHDFEGGMGVTARKPERGKGRCFETA
jgi:hypothetical protein